MPSRTTVRMLWASDAAVAVVVTILAISDRTPWLAAAIILPFCLPWWQVAIAFCERRGMTRLPDLVSLFAPSVPRVIAAAVVILLWLNHVSGF